VVTGFVYRDDDAYAANVASCYPHRDEAWIDVIFGTWGADDTRDHVTFGCRVGPVAGQPRPACSLVAAASVTADDPIFGEKLEP
jgi:hypothetical protein